VQYDKTSRAPIEALMKFAREMKRPDDADAAYRELLVRDKESAGPHVAYGDFLASEKKERLKAIEQYQLALVWAPQDPEPKNHALGVYVDWAQEHFDKGENANAEARLRDAQKWVTDPSAPQAQRMRELQGKLAAIRR
jgi:Tfp pilus assembly protein PilF